MAAFAFPLEQLMAEASALMPYAVPHLFGMKEQHKLQAAPLYVWIPAGAKNSRETVSHGVGAHRVLLGLNLSADVLCKGRNYAQSWGLASNLVKALRSLAEVDAWADTLDFVEPSKSHNQAGETVVVTVTLATTFVDQWVDITTLDQADASTVIATKLEGTVETSEHTHVDGEPAVTVET